MADRVEIRTDVASAGAEARSGVRLSKLRDGRRTWVLTLLSGDPPDVLRNTIAALVELDGELEAAYGETEAPRVRQTPQVDDDAGVEPGNERRTT